MEQEYQNNQPVDPVYKTVTFYGPNITYLVIWPMPSGLEKKLEEHREGSD